SATFDYIDENGELLFQVLRYHFHKQSDGSPAIDEKTGKPIKTFRQRRPDPDDPKVWVWGLGAGEYLRRGPGHDWYGFSPDKWAMLSAGRERKTIAEGTRLVPYQLPELLEAISLGHTISVVEGEAKAEALAQWGIVATCNAGGANKWRP